MEIIPSIVVAAADSNDHCAKKCLRLSLECFMLQVFLVTIIQLSF